MFKGLPNFSIFLSFVVGNQDDKVWACLPTQRIANFPFCCGFVLLHSMLEFELRFPTKKVAKFPFCAWFCVAREHARVLFVLPPKGLSNFIYLCHCVWIWHFGFLDAYAYCVLLIVDLQPQMTYRIKHPGSSIQDDCLCCGPWALWLWLVQVKFTNTQIFLFFCIVQDQPRSCQTICLAPCEVIILWL